MRRAYLTLALILLIGWIPLAEARVVVRVGPPAPRHEVIAVRPGPNHVWMAGYWRWNGAKHLWVGGKWLPGRPGETWVAGHWNQVPGGWEWIDGHWRKP